MEKHQAVEHNGPKFSGFLMKKCDAIQAVPEPNQTIPVHVGAGDFIIGKAIVNGVIHKFLTVKPGKTVGGTKPQVAHAVLHDNLYLRLR